MNESNTSSNKSLNELNELNEINIDNIKIENEDNKTDEDNKNVEDKLVPANINSKNLPKSSGIFHDIKSMDGRLERLDFTTCRW